MVAKWRDAIDTTMMPKMYIENEGYCVENHFSIYTLQNLPI